jgi:hypothetical protein
MKRHLRRQGVKLVKRSTGQAYVVSGTVKVSSATDGRQPVSIRWHVISPDGSETTVKQDNTIQKGALDGAWGATANAVARAAAQSVAKLVNKPVG